MRPGIRQGVGELKLQVIGVELVELHDPGVAHVGRIVHRKSGGQTCDRRRLRRHAGVGQFHSDVNQALIGARRHEVRVERIDDVVAGGAGQRLDLLLDRKGRVGSGRHHGCAAENLHAARGERRRDVARHAEQADFELCRAYVAVAVTAVVAGIGRRRGPRGRRRGIGSLLQRRFDGVLRRLVKIGDARELGGRRSRGRRRDLRRRRRFLLRRRFSCAFVSLLAGILVRGRSHGLEAALVHQLHFADLGKNLLRTQRLVAEDRFRRLGADQIERISRQDDFPAVLEEQDKIDVEDDEFRFRRRKIEFEIGSRRNLDHDVAAWPRTMNHRCGVSIRRHGCLWIGREGELNGFVGHCDRHFLLDCRHGVRHPH